MTSVIPFFGTQYNAVRNPTGNDHNKEDVGICVMAAIDYKGTLAFWQTVFESESRYRLP
jgi:hypothetical protein